MRCSLGHNQQPPIWPAAIKAGWSKLPQPLSMLLQLQCTLQYKCTETSNKTNSRQLGWLQSSKLEQASQLLSLPMLLQLPMQAARDLPPELQ